MLVELDVFSGRPNPVWRLDRPSARALEGLHRRLPETGERPLEPPGLGYRGFVYDLGGATWRAFRGSITSGDRALADPTRAIERLLLESLPARYAELRPRVATEIQRRA